MPKHSKKKSKKYTWLPHEVEFLQLNYSDVSNTVLAKRLNKSKHSIATKAFQLGLKKNPNVVECKGSRSPKKYREETELTADIICFYDRRGVGIEQIARDMNCPVRQVEEIIARCKADGSYERFRQQENSGIHFDADSPLFVRVPDSGNTRGGWRGGMLMYGLLLESNNKYIKDRVPGRAWANAKHVWEEGAGKQQNEDASKSSIEYKAKPVTRKGEY